MAKTDKILERVLRGASDANIDFQDLRHLLSELGFEERVRGSHHIYTKDGGWKSSTYSRKAQKQNLIRISRFAIWF